MPRSRKPKTEPSPPTPPVAVTSATAEGTPPAVEMHVTVTEPPPAKAAPRRRSPQPRRPRASSKTPTPAPATANGPGPTPATAETGREALTAAQAEASELREELARMTRELREARQQLTEETRRETQAAAAEAGRLRQECAEARDEMRELADEIVELREQVASIRVEAVAPPPPLPGASQPEPASAAAPPPAPEPTPEPHNLLGVSVGPGVVVAEVGPDSPAAHAGLMPGDLVLAVGDTLVASGAQLREMVQARQTEGVALRIGRAGEEQQIHIAPEAPPDGSGPTNGELKLGVEVAPGVVVAEVLPGTPAEEAGIAPGDVITGVGGVPVHTGLQLRELVLGSASAGSLTVQARRGPEEMAFAVVLNEEPQPAATA